MKSPVPPRSPLCFTPAARLEGQPAARPSAGSGRLARLALLIAGSFPVTLATAQAQNNATLTTLYTFTGSSDSAQPSTALVQGNDGNFYGATGPTIYKLTPTGVFTTLYTFTGGSDGADAQSGLIQGSDGNFYGTALLPLANTYALPLGTIYKLTPAGVLTTLYTFTGGSDGDSCPYGLTQGSDGNFYGTTMYGGAAGGDGTIFQLTPTGTLTTLYTFTGGLDGGNPVGQLVMDSQGNFYGATSYGGGAGEMVYNDGTVFKITPAGVFTSLYSFLGGNGVNPEAGLTLGIDGFLYGSTDAGEFNDDSTVFQIGPFVTPARMLNTLHYFTPGTDGSYPSALVQGTDHIFYGTTTGTVGGPATVFKVSPVGQYTAGGFSIIYTFTDGGAPASALILGSDGNFYGTTYRGGANGNGTIFKLTVNPAFFDGQVSVDGGFYFLAFPGGNYFGFYTFLDDPHYLYHLDLGYEYITDANDRDNGIYLYDFASGGFFYTSPFLPFPYLYDFGLNSFVYYYPDPDDAGRYNTDGVRYFYDFNTGQIISK